jgi:uncharacterized tellurite resistance protein B-like protein
MFEALSTEHRVLLLKYACAFAWADLVVTDSERRFVTRLMDKMDLPQDERAQVDSWLAVAPSPQSVDPADVPREHRHLFIEAVRAMIYVDGTVDAEERESFDRFRAALER